MGAAPEGARGAEDNGTTLASATEAKQEQTLGSKSRSIRADANGDAGESAEVLLL